MKVCRVLLEQTAHSRLWPDDHVFKKAWLELPAYHALKRARLRMVLEAIEVAYRTEKSEKIDLDEVLTVEHLLPQAWRNHWESTDGKDSVTCAEERDARLHRFGNLTLLTKKLNPSISDSGWTTKHPEICQQSALALNRELQKQTTWDEDHIEDRSRELLRRAFTLWPRPQAAPVALVG